MKKRWLIIPALAAVLSTVWFDAPALYRSVSFERRLVFVDLVVQNLDGGTISGAEIICDRVGSMADHSPNAISLQTADDGHVSFRAVVSFETTRCLVWSSQSAVAEPITVWLRSESGPEQLHLSLPVLKGDRITIVAVKRSDE